MLPGARDDGGFALRKVSPLLGVKDEQLLDEIPGLLGGLGVGREHVVGRDDLLHLLPQSDSVLLSEGRAPGQHLVQNDSLQDDPTKNNARTLWQSIN